MTIYEIKRRVEEEGSMPFFFSRKSMRFFGQSLKSFSVHKMADGKYYISAPYGVGKPKGKTEKIFNPETNKLETVK